MWAVTFDSQPRNVTSPILPQIPNNLYQPNLIANSNNPGITKAALMPFKPIFRMIPMAFSGCTHHFPNHELLAEAISLAINKRRFAQCLDTPGHAREDDTAPKLHSDVQRGTTSQNMGPFMENTPSSSSPVAQSRPFIPINTNHRTQSNKMVNRRNQDPTYSQGNPSGQ